MTLMKKIIPMLDCKEEKLFFLNHLEASDQGDTLTLCRMYDDQGADALFIRDISENEEDHEQTIYLIKNIASEIDIPIITGGRIKNLEDIKKYLYAGAQAVFLDVGVEENLDIMKEASDRFGEEKIYAYLPDISYLQRVEECVQLGASEIILNEITLTDEQLKQIDDYGLPFILSQQTVKEPIQRLFSYANIQAVALDLNGMRNDYCLSLKHYLKSTGIHVDLFESKVSWSDFKLNQDEMIPVIVQDYKTLEVLMLAYMNQESFAMTIASGMMTYFSRSRGTLWKKGETSGHVQYVKSLDLDCDNDTLLAKVKQVGPACHTGAQSCFFNNLVKKEYSDVNPLKVFEEVYETILNRKQFPKEGSYTNYLFDKGLDKILKKLGEEATEIVIAAKNPNTEEIKYEISDFLYHMMVLMAEKKITWEEITKELSNRS